jgi:ABC-type transport system involved in multi-copper enzyme maturation permease subunit
MQKFWAMLKDSYKEAVDGWIFLVMLVLAGIVILLVGSLSVTPLEPEPALGRMVRGDGPQFVTADRGQGTKLAIFLFQPSVSNVQTTAAAEKPWSGTITFDIEYKSSGQFGAAGAEVELDNDKKPKIDEKAAQQAVVFGDPFREAVRYWAGKPGEKRPEYTDALAEEFVAAHLRDATRLNVTRVEKVAGKGGGGGLLGGILGGSGPAKFTVTAEGGDPLGWTHRPSLFFGLVPLRFYERPLGNLIYTVENTLVAGVGAWVIMLAGVIVTAGFIPNMLRKGSIDLLLTKPLSRPLVLLYKYLGGLLFVFLLTLVAVGGVWLMVGLRTGVWAPGILYAIGGITFYFAILYACSTMVGVLTRNPIVSIVVTIVFWFIVWLIGTVYGVLVVLNTVIDAQQRQRPAATQKAETAPMPGEADGKPSDPAPTAEPVVDPAPPIPEAVVTGFKWANRVTPRTTDLDNLITTRIAKDLLPASEIRQATLVYKDLQWGEVLAVAGAWIALFLGLAMLRFVTRSY